MTAKSRRTILIAGCLGFVALALATLCFTIDTTPSYSPHVRRWFGLWHTRHFLLASFFFLAAATLLLTAVASRRLLLAVFSIVISLALAFALLEAAGAVGLVNWSGLLERRVSQLGTRAVPYLDVAGKTLQDTAPFWGIASDPIQFTYHTDRRGYRNDIDREAADVYLLGDSVLVAALVPFRDTVTARLEKAIQKPVMEIALIGLGPQEEHQIFRDAKLEVRGRLVIQFIFEGNDLLDSKRFRERANKGLSVPFVERSLSHQLLITLQRLTQPVPDVATLRTGMIGEQEYTFVWARESFAGLEGEAVAISDALENFASEIRDAGGEFAIVFVPSKIRVLGPLCRFPPQSDLNDLASHLSPLRDYLHSWSERTKIDLLDLTEPLQDAARAGRIPWFWGDTHWNAEGHAVAAEAMVAWGPITALK
jgi:hypothetical protein